MWYSGAGSWEDTLVMLCNFNTGYATSPDGINWTKHGMVLERSAPGEWDAYCAFAVTVILENTLYRMWYTGIDTLTPNLEYTEFWSVGYATAPVIGDRRSSKLKTQNFILTAHPNPFTHKTVISYQLSDVVAYCDTPLQLQIYDLAGRLIRTFLINQSTNSLIYSITWDRTDNSGRKVKSGIYFCKLEVSNKFSKTKKLILLR
jgi:hypothetical protein